MTETQSDQTTQLWNALGKPLRFFIASKVSNQADAEDILQETFLRIHKNIDQLDKVRGLQAWIYTIAKHAIIDYYRRHKPTPLPNEETLSATDVRQTDISKEVSTWLPHLLNNIPEPAREAVRLYELEGLSQQAIADRLGLSLSGAKSRIQRGRTRLKDLLLKCCSFARDQRGNIIDYTVKSGCDSACDCS